MYGAIINEAGKNTSGSVSIVVTNHTSKHLSEWASQFQTDLDQQAQPGQVLDDVVSR